MTKPIQPQVRPHCYICGATENLTGDHIPPQGFFPPHQATDLIADCCQDCHRRLSDDDLVMRFWLSCSMNASAAGKWIYFNKAVPSIQKRPCLQKQILAHTTLVKGRGLPPLAMQTDIPTSRVIPYMRRFTKALLYLFYPDYNYCSDTFGAVRDSLADWKAELPLMKYESRGRAVFEVWHNLDTDEDGIIAGLWIYRFYGDSVFTCRHSAKPRFTVEYPKGYKEYPKLPKYL